MATKKKKPIKPRAAKYDEKLQIKGSFEELVKELVTPKKALKKGV
jgi:hypothetical protein